METTGLYGSAYVSNFMILLMLIIFWIFLNIKWTKMIWNNIWK